MIDGWPTNELSMTSAIIETLYSRLNTPNKLANGQELALVLPTKAGSLPLVGTYHHQIEPDKTDKLHVSLRTRLTARWITLCKWDYFLDDPEMLGTLTEDYEVLTTAGWYISGADQTISWTMDAEMPRFINLKSSQVTSYFSPLYDYLLSLKSTE